MLAFEERAATMAGCANISDPSKRPAIRHYQWKPFRPQPGDPKEIPIGIDWLLLDRAARRPTTQFPKW
jgi:hypothetical protein